MQEEQQKWGKMCEKVESQLDEDKLTYLAKFPVDPYRRDRTFVFGQKLQKELSQTF
jgi:hypothetical protein